MPGGDAEDAPLGPDGGEEVAALLHGGAEGLGVHSVNAGVLPPGQALPEAAGKAAGPLVVQEDGAGEDKGAVLQVGEEGGQASGGVAGALGDELRPGGEAPLGGSPVVAVADHQEPAHTGALQRSRQPATGGVKENVLQHEGGGVVLPGQEHDGSHRSHKKSLQKRVRIRRSGTPSAHA